MNEATTPTTQPATPPKRRSNFLQVRIPQRDNAFARAVEKMTAAVGDGKVSAAVRRLVIEHYGDEAAQAQ